MWTPRRKITKWKSRFLCIGLTYRIQSTKQALAVANCEHSCQKKRCPWGLPDLQLSGGPAGHWPSCRVLSLMQWPLHHDDHSCSLAGHYLAQRALQLPSLSLLPLSMNTPLQARLITSAVQLQYDNTLATHCHYFNITSDSNVKFVTSPDF